MRGPWDLVHGAERSLGVVRLGVNRLIGSDVRVAEKIAGGDYDVTERGDVVNGSEAILRSLGVVRRFATVSNGERERRREMRTQVPLSVAILGVDPCRVGLLHEGIPIFRGAAGKDGDEGGSRVRWKSINVHDLLVVLAEVEVLFVVEEKVLRWGKDD